MGMAHPFVCRCGTPRCLRLIAGAKYLALDTLGRYALSPHVSKAASDILRAGETESNTHRSERCIAAAGGFGLASLSESD
jgi:hypothetical protein